MEKRRYKKMPRAILTSQKTASRVANVFLDHVNVIYGSDFVLRMLGKKATFCRHLVHRLLAEFLFCEETVQPRTRLHLSPVFLAHHLRGTRYSLHLRKVLQSAKNHDDMIYSHLRKKNPTQDCEICPRCL